MTSSIALRDAALDRDAGHTWRTVVLAVFGVFVTYVPINAVATALGAIADGAEASRSQLQGVTLAYVIAMAAMVLPAGAFGARFGRRRLFVAGASITAAGTALAIVASVTAPPWTLGLLICGQAIAGVGGGILLPTTLALISGATVDPRRRAGYVAWWAGGTTAGLAVGPLISGFVIDVVGHWGLVYVVPCVVALIVAVLGLRDLPRKTPDRAQSLDLPGQVLSTLAMAALVGGIALGGSMGWGSPVAVAGLVGGGAAAVAFVIVERRRDQPIVDLQIFRSPVFTVSTLTGIVALLGVVGLTFILSLFYGTVEEMTTMEVGIRVFVPSGVAALVSPLAARLLRGVSAMVVLAAGLAVGALGLGLIAATSDQTAPMDLVWRLGVFGIATALMLAAAAAAAVNAVPSAHSAMAGAANTALRQFGAALGPAVLGAIFLSRLDAGVAPEAAFAFTLIIGAALLGVASLACWIVVATRRLRQ